MFIYVLTFLFQVSADYTPTALFPFLGRLAALPLWALSAPLSSAVVKSAFFFFFFYPVPSTHPSKSTHYIFVLRGPRGLIMGGSGTALAGFPANAAEY